MEFIRTIKQKQQASKQENIQREAEETITLSDFDSTLYIAYQGTPLIAIEDDWTPKDIVQKLAVLRGNYIKSKQSSRRAAML